MQATIIGYGNSGRLHHRSLKKIGVRAFHIVDPKSCPMNTVKRGNVLFSSSILPHEVAKSDIVTIAVPTGLHFDTLLQVYAINPRAKIYLEKPLCKLSELPSFKKFILKHGEHLQLQIIDQYYHSSLLQVVRNQLLDDDPIQEVRVELSKNRNQDEQNGRYQDTELGVLGYEWFHMLSILKRLLPEKVFSRYLNSHMASRYKSVFAGGQLRKIQEHYSAANEPTIHLSSSMDGRIFEQNKAIISVYSHPKARHYLYQGKIPQKHNLKFRFVEVKTQKRKITIIYEPHWGFKNIDYKNSHLILINDVNGHQTSLRFDEDQFTNIFRLSFHLNRCKSMRELYSSIRFMERIRDVRKQLVTSFTFNQEGARNGANFLSQIA